MARGGSRAVAWPALILEIRGPTPWAALQSCGSAWVIDLGPEGRDQGGGKLGVAGTLEGVAEHPTSGTGRTLKQNLKRYLPEVLPG